MTFSTPMRAGSQKAGRDNADQETAAQSTFASEQRFPERSTRLFNRNQRFTPNHRGQRESRVPQRSAASKTRVVAKDSRFCACGLSRAEVAALPGPFNNSR